MRDLAIVAPDPGFGGGGRALTEALWRAAEEVGREPQLHFLSNPRLPGDDDDPVFTRSRPVRSWLPLPDLEAHKLWLAAPRVADRLRRAKTCFVCAPAASYGYGAVLSRRPYGCWAGTTVDDEWAARRDGVDGLRRTAHAAGAPRHAPAGARDAAPRARAVGDLGCVAAVARRARARARGSDPCSCTSRSTPSASPRSPTTSGSAGSTRRGSSSSAARPIRARTSRCCSTPSCGCANAAAASAAVPRRRTSGAGGARRRRGARRGRVRRRAASKRDAVRAAVAAGGLRPGRRGGARGRRAGARRRRRAARRSSCASPAAAKCSRASTPDELADRAEALLGDGDRLREMRRRGRAYVVREHDPARLREALREALDELDAG